MTKNKKWIVLDCDTKKAEQISKTYNISPLTASVILNRGITDDDEIRNFILKDDSQFFDPFLLKDMQTAVDFIKDAVKSNKKIAIYGDYDVDGITSTYILYDYLKSVGADVMYYIPDRADEGYGVNADAISRLKDRNVQLIITVDVGITAVEETLFAKNLGIDIIITDHHTPKETLPDAVAVINPKTDGNNYPNTELAGVGVAYKLCYALSDCDKNIMKKYSEAAAIGTIADMVPLCGENRFIASFGLDSLKHTNNVGLNALINVAGIEKTQLSSANVSFGIAPRLNAAGRIASATASVELFLEKDKKKAMEIALCLDEDNKTRQAEEHSILEEAQQIIERDKLYNDNVIIVAKEGWHHGVIGIVSSKITEKYYKPSAVISINEDGTTKASGRSISGFNLFDALSTCSDVLLKFGGHSLAAGFSLEKGKIDVFRKRINEYSKDILTDEILTPKLIIDKVITPKDMTCSTVSEMSILEPFGIGNKIPVFCMDDVSVSNVRTHKSGKHVFYTLEKGRSTFDAPAFNIGENAPMYSPGDKISVAGSINLNTFRGVDNVQFIIKDIKNKDNTYISKDNLRCIFINIRDYVTKNIYKFKIDDLKNALYIQGHDLSVSKIKTAFRIFEELELVTSEITNDTVYIKRDKNFYSKCNLEDSSIYMLETKANKK